QQTQAAVEANKAKTKFLAAASHDLRQPVHALNLFIEVLGQTPLDKNQQEIMGHIHAANHASRDMLNTLLDYSRIEAGVMESKPQPTRMATLLLALQEEFGPQADAKNLVYRSRDTQAIAHCDPGLTALVLRNFVSNAIRYTQRGGVLVAVRERAGMLCAQVWDTGIGIAADQHEVIFKEFHQLGNEERDRQKGLGLGLAIVKGLASTMDTRVSLRSRPGRGSVFELWLARGQAPAGGVCYSLGQLDGASAPRSGPQHCGCHACGCFKACSRRGPNTAARLARLGGG
ncbi:MAG: sensor histidine kinase, partial [Brachymonas sp.]